MNYIKLSKIISHALRHEPQTYNLSLSKNGWVHIGDLVRAIKSAYPEFGTLTSLDIKKIVNNSVKKRHEIKKNQIRALYGHSITIEHNHPNKIPPEFLYHGTSKESFSRIKKEGLKKMQRQHVHLSIDIENAKKVAHRKSKEIIILQVNALKAFNDGIPFYNEGDVWLIEGLSPDYISNVLMS